LPVTKDRKFSLLKLDYINWINSLGNPV
jgi:hypothetical protein